MDSLESQSPLPSSLPLCTSALSTCCVSLTTVQRQRALRPSTLSTQLSVLLSHMHQHLDADSLQKKLSSKVLQEQTQHTG